MMTCHEELYRLTLTLTVFSWSGVGLT